MKRTFVRLSRAKSVNCWLRSGEKSSISKGSRPTCIRVIANCKIDFGRHVFTAHHCRADKASQKSGMVLHFLCFYGHPTISTWFTSEYKKSGKKLDMGKGCVRFKSLEDLALDVVGRTVARVSAQEHMASYQAARALMGKGRDAGEGAAGLSRNGLRSQTAGLSKSSAKSAKKSAVKNGAKGMRCEPHLYFMARWAGIATREECLAVEHRGSDRDTTRAVQAETKRSDPGDSFSEHAPWFLHQYASCDTRLVTGCGQWENSGPRLSHVRGAKERGTAHHLNDWGPEG